MRVLLVGAGNGAQELARGLAEEPDVEVEIAVDAATALDRMAVRPFDAAVTELELGTPDGIELVRCIRQRSPKLPLVILTRDATVDHAVASMRAGATDFIPRPVDPAALAKLLRRALGEVPLREQLERLRRQRGGRARDFLAGEHPRLDAVRAFAERVAQVPDATVLITGESGTGKSCLASAVHALAGTGRRFVEVACSALPAALVESELFGHERGAFTDARNLKRGLIETAAGGTLFLDEIGSLPLDLQTKLLVFLESRTVRRVGGTQPMPVSVRVIAAANHDLRVAVREGRFRSDLLYRLDVASVHMPALREMPDVIPELATRFAAELASHFHQPKPVLDALATAQLRGYQWPGNVRELKNAVERAMIFHDSGPLVVRPPDAPIDAAEPPGVLMPPGLTLDEVERRYLLAALRSFEGDYTTLAARLGISRKTLWDKRRRLGLGGGAADGTRAVSA